MGKRPTCTKECWTRPRGIEIRKNSSYYLIQLYQKKYIASENDVLFSNDTGMLGKRNSAFPQQVSQTYDLPITSSDTLPLSYRRLVGAKAIKLGSNHSILLGLECQ